VRDCQLGIDDAEAEVSQQHCKGFWRKL